MAQDEQLRIRAAKFSGGTDQRGHLEFSPRAAVCIRMVYLNVTDVKAMRTVSKMLFRITQRFSHARRSMKEPPKLPKVSRMLKLMEAVLVLCDHDNVIAATTPSARGEARMLDSNAPVGSQALDLGL